MRLVSVHVWLWCWKSLATFLPWSSKNDLTVGNRIPGLVWYLKIFPLEGWPIQNLKQLNLAIQESVFHIEHFITDFKMLKLKKNNVNKSSEHQIMMPF